MHIYIFKLFLRQNSSVLVSLLTFDIYLYNNQINARTLIGQSAMFYCASKLKEKLRVF